MKTVYYLQPSSFCFGVEKSIIGLHKIIQDHPSKKIYCIHALVHNPKVTKDFENLGITFIEDINDIQEENAIVVFSAHGTKRSLINQAQQKFEAVYNLECPFVSKIYKEADQYIQQGITTFFYIGKEKHQEGKNVIEHLSSQGATMYVFENKEDIPIIAKESIIAVISQTTLNFNHVQDILQKVKELYPNAKIPQSSDVCKATCDRQSVILQNVDKFETFIVIGGKESNNTKELYEIGVKNNKQTFYGESLADIIQLQNKELLMNETVAVTGGASTPQEDIQEIVDFFVNNGYHEKALLLQ